MLLVVAACGSSNGANPAEPRADSLAVEDVAMRFAQAALAGDRATARSLTLSYDAVAQITKKADPKEWEEALEDVLRTMEREGKESGGQVTRATIVERRTLTPGRDAHVLREVAVAVISFEVRERDGRTHASPFPWLFIRTDAGWRFSPKQ